MIGLVITIMVVCARLRRGNVRVPVPTVGFGGEQAAPAMPCVSPAGLQTHSPRDHSFPTSLDSFYRPCPSSTTERTLADNEV
jgi:hypothetical protein